MNWPTCNCGSERIHLTTDNIENKCSCCNQKKRTHEWGWRVWCDRCNMWTKIHKTPQEVIDAFNNDEVS